MRVGSATSVVTLETDARSRIAYLRALEQKVLWLAVWMIHHANHVRPKPDTLKVGGHQASSASAATLMTALFFDVLRQGDRVAVKPHASPVFHAIQYLLGRQTREKLERFRAFGGAQSYPSRTKDTDGVDFSTGSVGLGVAMTTFAALVQDYLRLHGQVRTDVPPGRMVALLGDAEFDEGSVFEAMLEGWKHDVRNVWWIVDYNRQSLDAVMPDRLFHRMDSIFKDMEWEVVTLKYGRRLQRAFARRGGDALQAWIDGCPNARYSGLVHRGGAAWRNELLADLGDTSGIRELLDEHDDADLHALMTNLGGHDLELVLDAFHGIRHDRPTCFLAYTIKGYALPFAGHKDNHASLMSADQIAAFRQQMHIAEGDEWDRFAGLDVPDADLLRFLASVPLAESAADERGGCSVPVPAAFEPPAGKLLSTQEGFGRVLSAIGREQGELADRIVTVSPDVTISTNLGGWVNRRGVFERASRMDATPAAAVASPQKWAISPRGQHIEVGIAENNLFVLLAALGLSHDLFGSRLIPIGTVYDPFIARGLDSLNYACYQDARFLLVATPSGLALAPEGGAHQSVYTPLIGIGQPSLTAFEPAYVDELAEMMHWAFEHLQAPDGGSVYLRLSTRQLEQPERTLSPELRQQIIRGAYWLYPPGPATELAIVASGAVLPEALAAHRMIAEDVPDAGLLVVTSADRVHREWIRKRRCDVRDPEPAHIERLLDALTPRAGVVTVLDGHSATLSWIGSVRGHRLVPLGVETFGQSGSIPDLYHAYGLDANAIVDGAARLCVWRS